jgi:hypothetical protein
VHTILRKENLFRGGTFIFQAIQTALGIKYQLNSYKIDGVLFEELLEKKGSTVT